MESKDDHPLKSSEPTSAGQTSEDGDKTDEKAMSEDNESKPVFKMNEKNNIQLMLGEDASVNVEEQDKEHSHEEKATADEVEVKQVNDTKEKDSLESVHKNEKEKAITTTNDEGSAVKDKFVDVDLTENNNSTKDSNVNESERRTRFSSEVEILPKPYFHAVPDTVITVPLASSNEGFVNEMETVDLSPVTLNATPSSPSEDTPYELPSYLPLTVFSCLFCCPIIGLFAVYKSYSVKKLVDRGEIRNAQQASKQARQLAMLTIVIGFLFVLAVIALAILITELS